MKKNPLNKGVLTQNAAGIGPPTFGMAARRARDLALIEGRDSAHVSQSDEDRARLELTGESDVDPREAELESIPEASRGDPVPGSSGRQAPESPPEDEDDEGRSESEQLFDEGVEEAERDQMLQAARAAAKEDARKP